MIDDNTIEELMQNCRPVSEFAYIWVFPDNNDYAIVFMKSVYFGGLSWKAGIRVHNFEVDTRASRRAGVIKSHADLHGVFEAINFIRTNMMVRPLSDFM